MKATRSDQIYIRYNETISMMCHISKNLYNQANYILRQQFLNHERLSGYSSLARKFSIPSDIEDHNNYQKLPAQTAQWTIKKVKQSWNSFFKARRAWKKYPEKFLGMPKPPKYKEKNGEFMLIFTNQQCRIEDKILKFPKIMKLDLRTRLDDVNLREVRIIPQGMGYIVEIVYQKELQDMGMKKPVRIMGIDMGVRNIVTMGDSISKDGIAVRGGVLKSINQFFNKEYARLKSISDRQTGNRFMTERERRLFRKRNRKIKDIMHNLSKDIVHYAKSRNIDTIIIGHNTHVNSQVSLPILHS